MNLINILKSESSSQMDIKLSSANLKMLQMTQPWSPLGMAKTVRVSFTFGFLYFCQLFNSYALRAQGKTAIGSSSGCISKTFASAAACRMSVE